MGNGPSFEEKLKEDQAYFNYVQAQRESLQKTQGTAIEELFKQVDNLLTQQVKEAMDTADQIAETAKNDLDKTKQDIAADKGKTAPDAPVPNTSKPTSHVAPRDVLVLVNDQNVIYDTESETTFKWLGDTIKNLVTTLTSVVTGLDTSAEKANENGKSIGTQIASEATALLNVFKTVFSEAGNIALVANGIASVLQSALSALDTTASTTLHVQKTIRLIAPGCYLGLYLCNSSYKYKSSFKSNSYQLSSYGVYIATSLSLLQQLEKLDTMREVFKYYKNQLANYNAAASEVSQAYTDIATIPRVRSFKVTTVQGFISGVKGAYMKTWLTNEIQSLEAEDDDAKTLGEYFNEDVKTAKDNIADLTKAREETLKSLNDYIDQLQKLAKI